MLADPGRSAPARAATRILAGEYLSIPLKSVLSAERRNVSVMFDPTSAVVTSGLGDALLHPHDGLGEEILSVGFLFGVGAEDNERRCWRACLCVACRLGNVTGHFEHRFDAVGVRIFAIGERIFGGL